MEYTLYKSYYDEDRTQVITDVDWADEIDLDNEPWQFNILLVLKRTDGYYLTTDSGCSCPTPFENHRWGEGSTDFTGPLTADQAREEVESLIRDAKSNGWSDGPDENEAKALLAKIV